MADFADRPAAEIPPTEARRTNTPRLPAHASPRSRQELDSITARSWVRKGINSVARSGIDTHDEIAQIASGLGEAMSHDRYRIHGRTYAQAPDGKMYPESGEGIMRLTRMEFRALRLPIEHNGRTLGFEVATNREPNMTDEVIDRAVSAFNERKASKRGL